MTTKAVGATAAIKPLDIPAILITVVVAVIFGLGVYGSGGGSLQLVIENGSRTWVYSLDAEEEVTIPGKLGPTVVRLHGGEAAVISSPCTNKTCITAGAIKAHGEWAACLPNGVFIRVEGRQEAGAPDAIAR